MTESISQGCFVIHPKKKILPGAPSSSSTSGLREDLVIDGIRHSDHDGFRLLFNGKESIEHLKIRQKKFQRDWQFLEEIYEKHATQLNAAATQGILDFVGKQRERWRKLSATQHELDLGGSESQQEEPQGGAVGGRAEGDHREAPVKGLGMMEVGGDDDVDIMNVSFNVKPVGKATKLKKKKVMMPGLSRMGGHRDSPYKEVPTGLICTGFNSPDHEYFFKHLSKEIGKKTQARVATLRSSSCQTMKFTLKTLVEQFVEQDDVDADDDGEIEVGNEDFKSAGDVYSFWLGGKPKKSKTSKLLNYDFHALKVWYSKLQQDDPGNSQILVVMIQDFESFEAQILRDLIQIVSDASDVLPIAFLFGVATTNNSISQHLDALALSRLSTERFYLESSMSSLNSIVEELFIDRIRGLKLGYKPYAALVDDYLLRSLSLSAFFKGFKYSLMEYYYSDPLSVLCETLGESEMNQPVKLSQAHLDAIRMLPSFKNYVESMVKVDPTIVQGVLTDDSFFENHLAKLLLAFRSYSRKYRAAFRILTALQKHFTAAGTKKPERVLYFMGLEKGLSETEFVTTAVQLSSLLPDDKLAQFLSECCAHLNAEEELFEKELRVLHDLGDKLGPNDSAKKPEPESEMEPEPEPAANEKGKRKAAGRAPATKKKRANADEEPNRPLGREAALQAVKQELKTFLQTFFGENLVHYTKVVLHEVFYTSKATTMKKALNPNIKSVIQTALAHPTHYLGDLEVFVAEASQDQEAARKKKKVSPDACMMFQVYLESGKIVSLFELYTTFASELAQFHGQLSVAEIRARFLVCMNELEFMGFIQVSQRKPDSIQRLTWD